MELDKLNLFRRVEKSAKWIRVKFGCEVVANSKQALLLIQYGPNKLPTYYFPKEDVRQDLLFPLQNQEFSDEVTLWSMQAKEKSVDRAAWTYINPPEDLKALQGYISFEWNKMDAWYAEEEEIFVHAKDPYKRVDVLKSSRHVQVNIGGERIADTQRPHLLFETHLPVRYYIPKKDVRMHLLEQTTNVSRCPYKGLASYYTVKVKNQSFDNIAWSYPDPIPENPKIKDLICFFNEQVDITVNGEHMARPTTPWS